MPVSLLPAEVTASLSQITQHVFATMGHIQLEEIRNEEPSRATAAGALLSYNDAESGMILIECDQSMALAFTRNFMPGANPRSLDNDVIDSMGELANMIAGNLKGLMPAETVISMPTVLCGAELHAFVALAKAHRCLTFESDCGRCYLTLLNRDSR